MDLNTGLGLWSSNLSAYQLAQQQAQYRQWYAADMLREPESEKVRVDDKRESVETQPRNQLLLLCKN